MRYDAKFTYYFQADASALGGVLDAPQQGIIPAQASASLPDVGGFASSRTGGFNFHEILSCRSAVVRVSGRRMGGGVYSTLVHTEINGLNILDVVTAERVTGQISVERDVDRGTRHVSLVGSHIQGLRIGGFEARPVFSPRLLEMKDATGAAGVRPDWQAFQDTGAKQADLLVKGDKWLRQRYGWMTSDKKKRSDALGCSLVDGLECVVPGTSRGHVIEIADFGRIFLGELLVSPASVRLSMIRAELGCNTQGQVAVAYLGTGGHTVPPS